MEIPTAPSQRKRVRFSYSDDSDADEAPKEKKPRFPKGKKGSDRRELSGGKSLGVVDGEEDDGTILSTDPRVAALERATRRDRISEQLLAEDTSVPDDVAVAEEDYGEEEDEERIEDGMRLEPFNLKQEREEGYFDAEGNYVEYRNDDDTKDAWLESAVVDTRLASKAISAAQSAEEEDADSAKGISKHEIADIKRRIASALEPGETVLRALRRLKGLSGGGKMLGVTKVRFDQLTEDAMKLLDDGDYNVYEELRETFQREVEGYDAIARLKSGVTNGAGSSSATSDMFSDGPDDLLQQGGSTNGLPMPGSAVKGEGSEVDIFGGSDDDEPGVSISQDNPGEAAGSNGQELPSHWKGAIPAEDSGYIFDESSGYYYNIELGYYYDVASGLYCSASTYQWYRFDEDQNAYEEVAI